MASTVFSFGDIRSSNSPTEWPAISDTPVGDYSQRGGLNIKDRGGLFFSPGTTVFPTNTGFKTVDTEAWQSTFTNLTLKTPAIAPATQRNRTVVYLRPPPPAQPTTPFVFERSKLVLAPDGAEIGYASYASAEDSIAERNATSATNLYISASGVVTTADTIAFGNNDTGSYRLKASATDVDLEKLDASGRWVPTTLSTGASSVQAILPDGSVQVVVMSVTPPVTTSGVSELTFNILENGVLRGCSIRLGS